MNPRLGFGFIAAIMVTIVVVSIIVVEKWGPKIKCLQIGESNTSFNTQIGKIKL